MPVLRVRCSDADFSAICAMAQAAGLKTSTFLRLASLRTRIEMRRPALDVDVLRELGAWGNNLNQMALVLNAGRKAGELSDPLISDVLAQLHRISSAVERIAGRVE